MNTNTSLRILFAASTALLLGLVSGSADYVTAVNGLMSLPDGNFVATVGQPTNSTLQLARGPVGPSGPSGSPSTLPGGIPGRGPSGSGDTGSKTIPSFPGSTGGPTTSSGEPQGGTPSGQIGSSTSGGWIDFDCGPPVKVGSKTCQTCCHHSYPGGAVRCTRHCY